MYTVYMYIVHQDDEAEPPPMIDRIVSLTALLLKRPADKSAGPSAKKLKATAQLLGTLWARLTWCNSMIVLPWKATIVETIEVT